MKIWIKPQLIVLTKSNPEEAVLSGCKLMLGGTTPTNVWPGCASYVSQGACGPCYNTLLS